MANDSYFDLDNRHSVYLQRLATSLINNYTTPNLQAAYKAARLILLDAESITSNTQLNKITAAIAREIKPQTELMWDEVTGELQDTAAYEAAFQAKMFADVAGVNLLVPVDKKIRSYIDSSLMTLTSGNRVNSGVWAGYLKQNTSSLVNTYKNQIAAGYSNQETMGQITKRLRNVTNGLLKNEAEALTRTGMSHYTINAREAMMRDNQDVITGRFYNSTFDNRTTLTCRGHADNPKNPWAIDDPTAPSIPQHFNCRSNWLFMVNGQQHPDGTKASVGGKKGKEAEEKYDKRENALNKRRDNPNIEGKTSSQVKYRGRRDSDVFDAKQVSGSLTADSWLRQQPRWMIESSLGKKRAALFIDEKINITKFTDMTGRKLTLQELKDSGI